jgi:hypothetical protein
MTMGKQDGQGRQMAHADRLFGDSGAATETVVASKLLIISSVVRDRFAVNARPGKR